MPFVDVIRAAREKFAARLNPRQYSQLMIEEKAKVVMEHDREIECYQAVLT